MKSLPYISYPFINTVYPTSLENAKEKDGVHSKKNINICAENTCKNNTDYI